MNEQPYQPPTPNTAIWLLTSVSWFDASMNFVMLKNAVLPDKVFRDCLGEFSKLSRYLENYPQLVLIYVWTIINKNYRYKLSSTNFFFQNLQIETASFKKNSFLVSIEKVNNKN